MNLKMVATVLFFALSAAAEEKRADEMPALTARSLVVTPAYPQPEEAAEVLLTIENSSTASGEDVEVLFYANGELLASRTVDIAAMSSATVSVPWMAKSAGSTTLVAKVDPRQVLVERDRYDNAFGLDVVASAPPAVEADFAVTAIEVLAPAESPGVLRVDVANEGTVAASAPLVIRRNGQLVQVADTGVIEAGKSMTIEVPWSDPDRGQMSAEVNPRWADAEPRSENNTLTANAATDGVDLRIEHLTFHTPQSEDGRTRRIGVHFRIVNDGAQDVKQPFRTRINPGAVNSDGKLVPAYVTTAALPAGETVYVTHIFESAPDEFTLNAEADADKVIAEADEQNNIEVKDFYNDTTLDPDRWVNIGPRRIGDSQGHHSTGRLSTMAIHPTQTSTMYVGAQLSGVWKTSNDGASWISVADSATVRVAALALAPDNPSRVYLVTPNDGVLRSDDAGVSWTWISRRNLAAMVHAGSALLINPADPNVMVVSSAAGTFRSSDGGVTWTWTLSGGWCTSLIRMPGNGLLYAALRSDFDPTAAGVYESSDWGATWRPIRGCSQAPLPTADARANIRLAASGDRLFVTYQQGNPVTFRLFRTNNLGCNEGGGIDYYFELGWQPSSGAESLWSGLWADPGDSKFLYMTGTVFWRSTNGGNSFSVTSTGAGGAHADHHHVGIDPNTPSTIYSLNDGGIYRSMNRGASGSWVQLGDGITNVEFYDGVAAPADASTLIGGTQDNGNIKGTAGISSWRIIRGGDGGTVDIDPTNSSIMYTMFQYSDSIMRSVNGGGSFAPAANGLPTGSQCYLLHYQIHPGQPATLVASCNQLWRTADSGSSWSPFFDPANDVVRTAIDGPAGTYYAGTSAGEIFRGPAKTWPVIFDHPDNFTVTDLEVNAADPSRLYASFNSNGVRARRIIRLVRSAMTGEFAWWDITSDLPANLLVRTIAIDRNRPLTLYAGTDRGVYQGRSTDHGLSWFWRPYNNGMPPADVRDLEVHPTSGIMRAFTHGRSAFEVTTSRPSDQPPLDPKQ